MTIGGLGMLKFEEADEAVWVAAVLMTYDEYMKKLVLKEINNNELYFRQCKILKKAKEMCIKKIEQTRISHHYNADNDTASHKYFKKRNPDSYVRLVYAGEFNGVKEKPNKLNLDLVFSTCNGEKTLKELVDFIDNDYTEYVRDKLNVKENEEVGDDGGNMKNSEDNLKILRKNQILYGPPGTGKTYNAIYRALEIIDKEKYSELIENPLKRDEAVKVFNQLLDDGQISFCTFHQSYGYEDFVEGLRSNEEGNGFSPKDGIFKQICDRALNKYKVRRSKYDFNEDEIGFFKMSLGEKGYDDDIYRYCVDNNCVALGWGGDIDYKNCESMEEIIKEYFNVYTDAGENTFQVEAIKRFKLWMKEDDIVIISDGNKMAKAIGRITSGYRYEENTEINYKHFRNVEWLYVGESIEVNKILVSKRFSQQSIYMFDKNDLNFEGIRSLIDSNLTEEPENNNYVLIIDEINRGNISKIFGELITLIEDDKRLGEKNALKVTLPYSNEKFGVPNNLYILGTMNTADRSIALLDTALRRRFEFFEYMPNEDVLPEDVEGINVREFLKVINDRIEYLFDREHTIGHAYFIGENLDFHNLVSIMKNKVIPLIQEYFYGDWEKVMLVLGGAGGKGNNEFFIARDKVDTKKLFKGMRVDGYQEQYKYSIVDNPSKEAFLNIYEDNEE